MSTDWPEPLPTSARFPSFYAFRRHARSDSLIAIFSLAALASAFLLFWVEPLFARMVLPLLGGAPAVWNTCLMFFQALLLLGYLYAHASARYLSTRRQIVLHLTLLAFCVIALPVGIPDGWVPSGSGNVVPWLLLTSLMSLGACRTSVSNGVSNEKPGSRADGGSKPDAQTLPTGLFVPVEGDPAQGEVGGG